MAMQSARLLLWSPRVLGILASLYVGAFALDAFGENRPLPQALADFLVHAGPAVILLALVIASFRREWIGAVAFLGLAVLYAATLSRNRLDWILAISGPLATVGALFLWSALRRGSVRAS